MTTEVQKYAPLILEEIKKAKHILLHCHPSPDPDSVGGALATYHALKSLGKEVTVMRGDSHTPQAFSAIPGFEVIVHKHFFDIDLSQFDLFVIQDSSSLEQISKYEPVVFPTSLKTIVIDHHITNKKFAEINLVDATYPSICQMLYDLFSIWNVVITPEIAKCLFIGMYTDTGGFKYPATTPDTFLIASKLVAIAPDYSSMIFTLENSRTEKELFFMGVVLNSIHKYFNNHVAISEVSRAALDEKEIAESEVPESLSNLVKSVVGWDIGITATEKHLGVVSISMRTRKPEVYDVSKIAMKLGGGGHKAAAGASLTMSLPEAIQKILEAIAELYPELGKA